MYLYLWIPAFAFPSKKSSAFEFCEHHPPRARRLKHYRERAACPHITGFPSLPRRKTSPKPTLSLVWRVSTTLLELILAPTPTDSRAGRRPQVDWPEHPFFAHSVFPADFSCMRRRTDAPALCFLVGACSFLSMKYHYGLAAYNFKKSSRFIPPQRKG